MIRFCQLHKRNFKYYKINNFIILFILILFTCYCNIKSSNDQKVRNKVNKKMITDTSKDYILVIDTTAWAKEEIAFPSVPSNYFAYEVRFSKGDSVISYSIDSEKADTCVPIFLDAIYIKTTERNISIYFKNKKIKAISHYYKIFLSSNISHIIMYYNDDSFLKDLMFEKRSEVDSFLRDEFGIKKQVKK